MALGNASVAASPAARRPQRITFLRPVRLRAVGQPGPPKRMFTGNLSTGGIYVRSSSPFPPGTLVEVFLEAQGQVLRFAEAEVAFSLSREEALPQGRLPGFGLRFTLLPPRSQALVDELLRMVAESRARKAGTSVPRPSPRQLARPRRQATAGGSRSFLRVALLTMLAGATAAAIALSPLASWHWH